MTELKPIGKTLEERSKGVGFLLKANWYFTHWWEKVLLIAFMILGGWKIFDLIFL